MSTTIRVSEATRDRLSALAAATSQPMTVVIGEALDALERQRFFDAFNGGYRRLREDAEAWEDVEAERAEEAALLTDHSS